MKRISNTIRIGMVRRGAPSPKIIEDPSSSFGHEQINHQPVKEQLHTQLSQNVSVKDVVPEQKRFSEYVSPNNVGLHDFHDLHNNTHQHSNDTNSRISQSASQLHQQKMSDIHEIPTKKKWLTPTKVVVGVVAALAIAAAIVVPCVLLLRSTGSALTTTTTSTTTVTSRTTVNAYWSFDNVPTDLYGGYDGTLQNSATYSSISNSTPYVGYGRAIALNANLIQFVLVSAFLNLSYTSFTIEAWINSVTSTGDRGIFGQCQCSTCSNQCLYLILRSGRLHIGFTSNELTGSTTMSANNTWFHVAFVYNYQTQQQILYVNGVQDAIKSNAQAYQGKNGTIQIGSTLVYSTTNYFHGYIDNAAVTTRAKSSDEILRDASVVAYYPFDLPDQTVDGGPNRLNGTSVSTVTISGRVNQAMRFTGSGSYFQVYGFYYLPWGVSSSRSFSISLWIYPTSGTNSTIVQLFSTSFGVNNCANLLGIFAPSSTAGQIFVGSSSNGPSVMTGPFVSQNTWTHISLTFSSTVGYTLYFNGVAFGSTGSGTYPSGGTFAYLFISLYTSVNCNAASLNVPYQGGVDEVYIHSRELTQSDVTALANP